MRVGGSAHLPTLGYAVTRAAAASSAPACVPCNSRRRAVVLDNCCGSVGAVRNCLIPQQKLRWTLDRRRRFWLWQAADAHKQRKIKHQLQRLLLLPHWCALGVKRMYVAELSLST